MRRDRIRVAMDAGRVWAERQIKHGIDITASTVENAAHERFTHAGFQHLFMCSALEVALSKGAITDDSNRPQSVR